MDEAMNIDSKQWQKVIDILEKLLSMKNYY